LIQGQASKKSRLFSRESAGKKLGETSKFVSETLDTGGETEGGHLRNAHWAGGRGVKMEEKRN